MKKFISMVMAAAMVVSLVPATAFAASGEAYATTDGTTKVTGALTEEADFVLDTVAGYINKANAPEVRIELDKVLPQETDGKFEQDITITLDGAEFVEKDGEVMSEAELKALLTVDGKAATTAFDTVAVDFDEEDPAVVTFTVTATSAAKLVALEGKVLAIDLISTLTSTDAGHVAYVTVDTTIENVNIVDVPYCSVVKHAITAEVKKVAVVAEDEWEQLKSDLVIKAVVDTFEANQKFEVKLSKGFEFEKVPSGWDKVAADKYTFVTSDGTLNADGNKLTFNAEDIEIMADTAKAGATCTMTIRAIAEKTVDGSFSAKTTVEVMTVCEYKVVMSTDEDEDTPVMWNGVNAANEGLTAEEDAHWSKEITIEETFPGAWGMRKGFELNLPAGVFVTDVKVLKAENFYTAEADEEFAAGTDEWKDAFWLAYQEGNHANFVFEKRTFNDVDTVLNAKPAKVVFQLELVAQPDFEGDVELELKGDLLETQKEVIAKFVAPYTIKAEQNDVKIDYRYTAIDTAIVITEAEAGLWEADTTFVLAMEKIGDQELLTFEKDAVFTVNEASEMTLKDKASDGGELTFTVKAISDEEAAEVTIDGIELYMHRSLPAGPYSLTLAEGSDLYDGFLDQVLFAPEDSAEDVVVAGTGSTDAAKDVSDAPYTYTDNDGDNVVADVEAYDEVAHPAFVNIITAGREVDDASFTTKVIVPIGETTIIAGEKAYTIPVPAYINADGYTMMPIRAVAVALGIANDAVQWDDATKTVIVMYGQRFITMTAGQKVVYVSGTALPAKTAVEIVDGRAFLGLRDLATALGVTTINYDEVTKTASLN